MMWIQASSVALLLAALFHSTSAEELELVCRTGAVAGRQIFGCNSNNPLDSVVCSFDGEPAEECSLPVVVGIGRFGTEEHTLVVIVTDVNGQTATQTFDFQLAEPLQPQPDELELVCRTGAVAGRQIFGCNSNNPLDSVVCSFDGEPAENCSLPVVVDIFRFGTERHTLVVTATDVHGQTATQTFDFQLAEPLQPQPDELELVCRTGAVAGRQIFGCYSNNPLDSVVCSFDGEPAEECSLPVVVDIFRFGTEKHTLVVTATDVHGQTVTQTFDFQLVEPLQPQPGQTATQTFDFQLAEPSRLEK